MNDLYDRMYSKTARSKEDADIILSSAFKIAKEQIMDNITALYNLVCEEIPKLPEVSILWSLESVGFQSLHITFQASDRIRKLSFIPLKVLEPREPFPKESGRVLISPLAVFVLKIQSNARNVQHGSFYLAITTSNGMLDLDKIHLHWEVNHLVCEAYPDVDRALIHRIVERAFVET